MNELTIGNLQDVKYAPKLSEVKEVLPAYPYRFEINFLRPFDNKTKFYSRVINNAVAEDVSNIISNETSQRISTDLSLNDK